MPPRPRPTLFPYTTLFRSVPVDALAHQHIQLPVPVLEQRAERFAIAPPGPGDEQRAQRDLELGAGPGEQRVRVVAGDPERSEEHTSELQSHSDLVCRLLLE